MVPVLLTVIGGKTYSLLRTLTSPDKPSTKSFGQIVAILKGHLSPKPLLIEERFRFHKQDQRDDENINTYVAEIKKLSEHWVWYSVKWLVKGQTCFGLYNESIQKRLLVETSLKAVFQSSHEAPRSLLRVHAWALSSNHNAKQLILIRCKHLQRAAKSFVRGLENRLYVRESAKTCGCHGNGHERFTWVEGESQDNTSCEQKLNLYVVETKGPAGA